MIRGCRQCRREGEKLFLKGDRCLGQKCAVIKRPYAPGVHGPKGQFRMTDYAKQLRAKQKARRYYQLAERQFAKYYAESAKSAGNTSELLWQRLESRLDNTIRRANLVLSLTEARQMVTHGMVAVNGKKVDIPSYQVKVGDKIALPIRKEFPNKQDLPEWISLDGKKGISIGSFPTVDSVETPFNINLVIEYYSK